MFFRRKKEWYVWRFKKPPYGIEVLMSNYEKIWFGRIEMWVEHKPLVFRKNDEDKFEFSWSHSLPLFWRYLPNQPERPNPEAP